VLPTLPKPWMTSVALERNPRSRASTPASTYITPRPVASSRPSEPRARPASRDTPGCTPGARVLVGIQAITCASC